MVSKIISFALLCVLFGDNGLAEDGVEHYPKIQNWHCGKGNKEKFMSNKFVTEECLGFKEGINALCGISPDCQQKRFLGPRIDPCTKFCKDLKMLYGVCPTTYNNFCGNRFPETTSPKPDNKKPDQSGDVKVIPYDPGNIDPAYRRQQHCCNPTSDSDLGNYTKYQSAHGLHSVVWILGSMMAFTHFF